MRTALFASIATLAASMAIGVLAADRPDMGAREYQKDCADCHGKAGKGDGLYSENLKARLPDLTTLSKRNGGAFPQKRVEQVIDGRVEVQAHGTRDMPVWGKEYLRRGGEYYGEVPYDPDAYVRARIVALTEHLGRLQAK
jgi:mono/diheme cytochrome c family protein